MRIDPLQAAAMANQADPAAASRDPGPKRMSVERVQTQATKPSETAIPPQTQLSVLIDSNKNIVYQFLDARTGEIVQQVPPEQVLQVMRSIADLLRQSEQKLRITV